SREVGGSQLCTWEKVTRDNLVTEAGWVTERTVEQLALTDRRCRVEVLRGNHCAGGALGNCLARDEYGHRSPLGFDSTSIVLDVDEDHHASQRCRDRRDEERPSPRRDESLCSFHDACSFASSE